MPAGDTVLQIVPRLPGTFDGVGDYALNLANALSADHGITTTFLVARPTSVTSKDGYTVLSGLNAAACGDLARAHRNVILHYVNYGYQSRGVPFSLRSFARQLRQQLAGRWITVFHELYASGPPWKSAFWLRPFQVGIARDLMDLSSSCVVSNVPIEQAIHAHDARKKVSLLPVMSNFGEPELTDFEFESPRRWAICGGTALIARSLSSFEKRLPLIPPALIPDHLDVVGGDEDASIIALLERLRRRFHVHHYPEVSVDLASEVLRQASFGWLDYFGSGKVWPGMVLKSTAFVALCAHGAVPVLSHREESIALGSKVFPGPYHLTADSVRLPPLEKLAALRRDCYEWYRAHAHSRQAARVYAEALP